MAFACADRLVVVVEASSFNFKKMAVRVHFDPRCIVSNVVATGIFPCVEFDYVNSPLSECVESV